MDDLDYHVCAGECDTGNRYHVLSESEGHALFDRRVRHRLGISGDEFLRRYDAGLYPDPDGPDNIMDLLILMPFAGRS